MKKCILIGALAALMLFAFTACEPQVVGLGSYGDKTVIGVDLASGQSFYGGDEIDSTNGKVVSVVLQYDDGTASQPINGVLKLANSTTNVIVAGENVANVTLSGADKTSTGFPVVVKGIAIAELSVNTENAMTEVAYSGKLTYDGLVVTAIYEDGTEKILDSTDYSPNLVPSATEDEVGTVTISLSGNFSDAAVKDYKKATYNVKLIGYKVSDAGAADDIKIEYYVGDATTPSTTLTKDNYGETIRVVYTVLDKGDKEIKEVKASELVALGGTTVKDSYTFTDKEQKVSFYYQENSSGKAIKKDFTIEAGDNYGTEIVNAKVVSGKETVTIPSNDTPVTIDNSYFTAEVKNAYGSNTTCSNITIIDGTTSITKDQTEGPVTFLVQFGYTGADGETHYSLKSLSIQAKKA